MKASLVPELPGPLLLQGPASEMNEGIILFSWSACESRGVSVERRCSIVVLNNSTTHSGANEEIFFWGGNNYFKWYV